MDRVGAVVARWFPPGSAAEGTLHSRPASQPASLTSGILAALLLPVFAASPAPAAAPAPTTALRAGPAAAETNEPLSITIDTLAPSVIPVSGPIRVRGTVTNNSADTWDNIGIYPLTSFDPLTTAEELAAAVVSDPAEPVGDRITSLGPLDVIASLAPGEAAAYSLRLPRKSISISGASGVYWFGVQGLGEVGGVREEAAIADGRARTFLPYVETESQPVRGGGIRGTQIATGEVRTALVLPLRAGVTTQPDGRVDGVDTWTENFGPEGRLQRALDFGSAAGSRPLTWLVDPAVADVAAKIAAGNFPFDLTSNQPPLGEDGEEPSDQATSSPDPSASPGSDPSDSSSAQSTESPAEEPTGEESEEPAPNAPPPPSRGASAAQSAVAQSWGKQLAAALQQAGSSGVLALPYGDLDLAAATTLAPNLVEAARERGTAAMERLALPSRPGVAPPGGSLPASAYPAIKLGETILVTPASFADEAPDRADVEGRILTTAPYVSGGPGPNDRRSLVALRQMILSQAALRLISDNTALHSLVVQFPPTFQAPTSAQESAAFFAGFDDLDWLRLSTVTTAASQAPSTIQADELAYSERQLNRELPRETFAASQQLIAAGSSLQTTLARNDLVASRVLDAALTVTSYSDRKLPRTARVMADRNRGWINRQLGKITITAPPSLTLSSGSGPLPATISNGLDYPVAVRIRGRGSGNSVTVTGPGRLRLAPGERVAIKLQVASTIPGVSTVTLAVTDVDDTPLGGTATLPVRAAEVGPIVWVIIGAGISLLFAAIGIRLVRRLRSTAAGES